MRMVRRKVCVWGGGSEESEERGRLGKESGRERERYHRADERMEGESRHDETWEEVSVTVIHSHRMPSPCTWLDTEGKYMRYCL